MSRQPPAAADPLTLGEFAPLLDALGPFEPNPHLAVAVSGGPDSMALAMLAAGWASARGSSVVGLVVDHGLRPGSADDADQAVEWLHRLGVAARILTWTGAKPKSGIQAAARAARIGLLQDACRTEAILHLLLAHHRDDQAETVVLRRAAGSGAAGLAGMAAVRELPGLRLLRPLLAVPKTRLLATLAAAGRPWLVDPANAAETFARGRLRADPTFAAEVAWAEGLTHAEARGEEDERVATTLVRLARPHPLGFVRLDVGLWGALEPTLRTTVLGRLLATVGGRPYPVGTAKVGRVAAATLTKPVTLGGCIIVRCGDDLVVCREPGRIRHRLPLRPGSSGLWDGRFSIRYQLGSVPVEVRALGPQGTQLLDSRLRDALRRASVPLPVLHGQPAAWTGATLAACPSLDQLGLRPKAGFSITALLRPSVPLTTAAFTGVNVVSNPQQPIYRSPTARVLLGESASAVSSHQPPRPTSRRTQ